MNGQISTCLDWGLSMPSPHIGPENEREILGLSQPNYLPWPGHLDLISRCPVFYFYDDGEYSHGGFRNRNRVMTHSGPQWLTVPVLHRGRGRQKIANVRINNTVNWRWKHWETLRHAYSREPFWPLIRDKLCELYSEQWEFLVDISMASTSLLMKAFGIATPLFRSSLARLEDRWHTGPGRIHRSLKLATFAVHRGAAGFIEGESGKPLLDPDIFRRLDVRLIFHRYSPPGYGNWPAGRVPGLSALDIFVRLGPQRGLDLIRSGGSINGDGWHITPSCPATKRTAGCNNK